MYKIERYEPEKHYIVIFCPFCGKKITDVNVKELFKGGKHEKTEFLKCKNKDCNAEVELKPDFDKKRLEVIARVI